MEIVLDDIISHYDQNQFYVKRRVRPYKYGSVSYSSEVKVYELLRSLDVAPKLIAHGIIYRRDWCGFYIVTERHGMSLLDKYFEKYLHDSYDGPGMTSVCPIINPDWFNHKFPDDLIPKGVVDQVRIFVISYIQLELFILTYMRVISS